MNENVKLTDVNELKLQNTKMQLAKLANSDQEFDHIGDRGNSSAKKKLRIQTLPFGMQTLPFVLHIITVWYIRRSIQRLTVQYNDRLNGEPCGSRKKTDFEKLSE